MKTYEDFLGEEVKLLPRSYANLWGIGGFVDYVVRRNAAIRLEIRELAEQINKKEK